MEAASGEHSTDGLEDRGAGGGGGGGEGGIRKIFHVFLTTPEECQTHPRRIERTFLFFFFFWNLSAHLTVRQTANGGSDDGWQKKKRVRGREEGWSLTQVAAATAEKVFFLPSSAAMTAAAAAAAAAGPAGARPGRRANTLLTKSSRQLLTNSRQRRTH